MPNEPDAAGQPCRVLLIGMMGSGKSTIGGLLAQVTGWPYVDNDELVRRANDGATAREILAERGEASMRAAEAAALQLGLGHPTPAIIGVAAGTILDPDLRGAMRTGGVVVWLRAAVEALEERATGADHRPFVDHGGESWIREVAREREPLYAEAADIVIDTSEQPPATAASELRDRLREVVDCR